MAQRARTGPGAVDDDVGLNGHKGAELIAGNPDVEAVIFDAGGCGSFRQVHAGDTFEFDH